MVTSVITDLRNRPDIAKVLAAAVDEGHALPGVLWDCLLPGLDDAASAQDDEILAERLRWLSFAPVPGSAAPQRSVKARLDASTEDSALPDGTTVIVDPVDGGWLLRFGSSLNVEVGHGEWRESSPLGRPVVATGAWQGDTFVAELYVITTPHRVRLVVDADAGSVGDVDHHAPDQPQSGVASAVAADDTARRRVGDPG